MTYITSSQGRPIQGVSQQPEKTRLPGQCTISENLRPDVVRGLTDRVGTKLQALLANGPTTDAKWYYYNRGTTEEYFISIEDTGKVRAWSPDGTEHTINVEDDAEASYLASASPKADLSLITVGDYTFMANNKVTVEESSSLTPPVLKTGIVYVQFIDYTQQIKVYLDGSIVASYVAPDGSVASELAQVRTELVCSRLIAAMSGTSGSSGDATWTSYGDITGTYNISQVKNTVVISRIDEADFTLRVEDSADNKNSVGIKGKITNTRILPSAAPEGFLLEVDPPGAQTSENSNFWLKAENTSSDHVTWRETIAPGISVGTDPATMPHVLVRESIDGAGVATFTLRQGEWEERKVGSDATNPQPTFVGSQVSSIGLVQNRLFFTSGESVILGRTADFFNFYRETAQSSLDTDPVDVFADVPQINNLEHHIFFDGDLVFFSNKGQFIMDGSKPITADNAVLRQVTEFESLTDVSPVPTGDAILFPFQYGRFTGVREFFTDSITDTKKARPVTDHVKSYVAGVPTIMKASTNINVLMIKTNQEQAEIFTYDWLWQGPEKVQSAWSSLKVRDTDEILHFEFAGEVLWMIINRAGSVYIEKMDMGDPPDPYTGYTIRLDRQSDVIMTWDEPTGMWRTPDILTDVPLDQLVAVRTEGAYPSEVGTQIKLDRDGAELVTDEELGEGTEVHAVLGMRYKRVYSPTNPVALDQNGLALNLDRLTVGAFYMNYNTSGDIVATLTTDDGGETSFEYGNRILGDSNNLIGFAPLVDGNHRVAVRKKSDRYTLVYTTESHLPLEVRDFEYNGNLNRRGRRI